MSDWNDKLDERLTQLAGKGYSFKQIAAFLNSEFGTSFTRNATLGRAHRKGWAAKTKAHGGKRQARPPEPKKKPRPAISPPLKPLTDDAPLPMVKRSGPEADAARQARTEYGQAVVKQVNSDTTLTPTKRFNDLQVGECKWIVGDVKDANSMACGREQERNSPYCHHHKEIAWMQSRSRRVA